MGRKKTHRSDNAYLKAVVAFRKMHAANRHNVSIVHALRDATNLLMDNIGARFWGGWHERISLKERLWKRAGKKVSQPFRKNMNRKRMARRAAGKNNTTRRR